MNAIRITDVAPRDGLQSEPRAIPTHEKLQLIELLTRSGVDEVEISSFVSPKWIPQLADAAEVFTAAAPLKPAGMLFSALIPNEKGLQAALAVNGAAKRRVIDKISVFTAASEAFSQRNTNATIAQTIERFRPVLAVAATEGLLTRGYVSTAIACPILGAVAPQAVADVAQRLLEIGVAEIDVADTIGVATPETLAPMLEAVLRVVATERLTLHLHDTHGHAAACVEWALRFGVRSFDGAVGGLGGCPYASTPGRRAPGNLDTLILARTVQRLGYCTRIEEGPLLKAAQFARRLIEPESPGA